MTTSVGPYRREIVQLWSPSSGEPVPWEADAAGAPPFSLNGAITAASGTLKTHVMSPQTSFTAGTPADENYQNSTGCKCFWIELGDVAIGAESLIVAWSTDDGVTATTQSAADTANTKHGTPDGAAMSNVMFVTDQDKERLVVYWDGENTIKTISLLLTGAANAGFTPKLMTVE